MNNELECYKIAINNHLETKLGTDGWTWVKLNSPNA
jgi:hypothetical protein